LRYLFWVIKFSFGSHVMGYAGAGVTNGRVARITGNELRDIDK